MLMCTYSLAVFGPGSLLCTRVDCVLTAWQSLGQVACCVQGQIVLMCSYSLAVFGPGSLLCTRADCELTAWQSLGQVACCVRG